MEYEERKELFHLNKFILEDKILPLVKNNDLRMKVNYCFQVDNIEFYLAWMPIWNHYEKWKHEAKEELDRIKKEHYIELHDKLY